MKLILEILFFDILLIVWIYNWN